MGEKRDYKIYPNDGGYSIYRKRYVGKLMFLEYLSTNNLWVKNKDHAKKIYTKDSAVDTLVLMRIKGDKMPTTSTKKFESEGRKERTSWSEL